MKELWIFVQWEFSVENDKSDIFSEMFITPARAHMQFLFHCLNFTSTQWFLLLLIAELLAGVHFLYVPCLFCSRTNHISHLFPMLLAWQEAAAVGRAPSPSSWKHWVPFGSTVTRWDMRCTSLAQQHIIECLKNLGQVRTLPFRTCAIIIGGLGCN